MNWIALNLIRPLIAAEAPGWGRLYAVFVGSYLADARWKSAGIRVIRDKRYKMHRILDLAEWADRMLYFLRRWYDLPAQILIDRLVREGDIVVDVGANYGHFSMASAVRAGSSGRVHSFEPNPVAFARLSTHIHLNKLTQVTLHNLGVSDGADVLTLTIPRINSGEASFGAGAYEEATQVDVRVESLDAIGIGPGVRLLKIDVEGFEERVILGARGLIQRDRPVILTEVVADHLRRAGSSPEALRSLLEAQGYQASKLQSKGRGSSADLELHPAGPDLDDGDYVWLPKETGDALRRTILNRGR